MSCRLVLQSCIQYPGRYASSMPGRSESSPSFYLLDAVRRSTSQLRGRPPSDRAPRITGYDASAMPTTPIAPAATAGFDRFGQPYTTAGVGWVQGRVADQNGAGIPSASITVDGFGTSGATDEQGNYRLTLSPGWHRIDPVSSGYGIPPRAVFITSGETTDLDIM